jgi:hypothetical protein
VADKPGPDGRVSARGRRRFPFVFVRADTGDQPVAPLGNRLDDPWVFRVVTKSAAKFNNGAGQGIIADYHAFPGHGFELLAGQHSAGVPGQADEHGHRLGFEFDLLFPQADSAGGRIDTPPVDAEGSGQIDVLLVFHGAVSVRQGVFDCNLLILIVIRKSSEKHRSSALKTRPGFPTVPREA